MANEAVCIETPTIFERKVIADGVTIPFGSIMQLSSDPNTITISASTDVFGGIMWVVKDANDGILEAVVAMNGVWDIKDSGSAMALGNLCQLAGVNLVKTLLEAEFVLGKCVGKCHETVSASEVSRIKVGSVF